MVTYVSNATDNPLALLSKLAKVAVGTWAMRSRVYMPWRSNIL